MHYKRDQVLLKQNETGNTFYILYQGRVVVEKDGEKVNELTADPENGQCPCFGEQALLKDEPRNATIRVSSNSAAVLVLDRTTFESILGPLR